MYLNDRQRVLLRLLLAAKFTHTQLEEVAQLLGLDLTGIAAVNKSSKAQEIISRARAQHLEQLVAFVLGKGPVYPAPTPKHLLQAEEDLRELATSVPATIQALPTASPPVPYTPPEAAASGSQFEFDVALSFAGEDRAYVDAVAQALRDASVRVFYDDFEEGALWGKNLYEHLTEVYSHRARYCIIFCSAHYAEKVWPNAERRAAQERALRSKQEYILPARFDDSEIPGILDTVGYIDLRQKSPGELAAIFLSKLRRSGIPAPPDEAKASFPNAIKVSGHVEAWEQRALGRFEALRKTRIDTAKGDPFARGFWQASFALQGELRNIALTELLVILRASETNRTGWDVGWVPTREAIAPYPFQDGIEVWLAEDGGREAGHSDFWRAEKIGTFALFRGYQEDEVEFSRQFPQIQLDYSLVLWHAAEVLLYLESLSRNLAAGPVGANLRIRWTGLENRRLGNHNAVAPPLRAYICRQLSVESALHLADTSSIKRTLISDVQRITHPLFEACDFFSLSEEQVKFLVRGLLDADKEGSS